MQALILATDEVSKLHPLTERLPAPLLPVLNRPVMAYPLELLVRAGLRDIGVAIYNKAGAIEAHFGVGTGHAARLTYFLQREPLGTAGSLRWAGYALKETFVVLPGDAIVDFDVCGALAFHRSHGGIATVIAHAPETGRAFHTVSISPTGVVEAVGRSDLPGARVVAATGGFIFEPRIFDSIASLQRQRPRGPLDCLADLLPELLGREGVSAYMADGYWNPIDGAPAYHQAQMDALAQAVAAVGGAARAEASAAGARFASRQEREIAPGALAGRRVTIHPSARLVPPVYIGAGSQIERDVELGPRAVIGANTIIDAGATVSHSSVHEGSYVGQLVKVERRIVRGNLVVDADSGESVRVVDPFLLGEVSPRLFVGLLSRAADWAGALLMLLLSLPALAALAPALLLTSALTGQPGRVLEFRPRVRWRRNNESAAVERETYRLPHFRTRRADGRFAPLGATLERTQLDRLPALVSVLTGDLRLVGVRPLAPSEADLLTEEWQRLPYEGPAGFTGLWHTQAADAADLDEIVATDAYYTATRSLREDLRLLLLTPVAWLAGGDRRRAPRAPEHAPRSRRAEKHLRGLPPAPREAGAQQPAATKRAAD